MVARILAALDLDGTRVREAVLHTAQEEPDSSLEVLARLGAVNRLLEMLRESLERAADDGLASERPTDDGDLLFSLFEGHGVAGRALRDLGLEPEAVIDVLERIREAKDEPASADAPTTETVDDPSAAEMASADHGDEVDFIEDEGSDDRETSTGWRTNLPERKTKWRQDALEFYVATRRLHQGALGRTAEEVADAHSLLPAASG